MDLSTQIFFSTVTSSKNVSNSKKYVSACLKLREVLISIHTYQGTIMNYSILFCYFISEEEKTLVHQKRQLFIMKRISDSKTVIFQPQHNFISSKYIIAEKESLTAYSIIMWCPYQRVCGPLYCVDLSIFKTVGQLLTEF